MYHLVCSKMFKFENLYWAQYFPIIFLKKTKPFLFLIKAEAVQKKAKKYVVLQDTFFIKYILKQDMRMFPLKMNSGN